MFVLFGKYRVGKSGRGAYEITPIPRLISLLDVPAAQEDQEPYLTTYHLPVRRCLRGSVAFESLTGGSARSTKHFRMEASEMTLNRGLVLGLRSMRKGCSLTGSRPCYKGVSMQYSAYAREARLADTVRMSHTVQPSDSVSGADWRPISGSLALLKLVKTLYPRTSTICYILRCNTSLYPATRPSISDPKWPSTSFKIVFSVKPHNPPLFVY